jgi:DNA-binding MarR family transcriptional regulator
VRAGRTIVNMSTTSRSSSPATTAPVPLSGAEEEVMRAFGRMLVVMPRALDADLQRDQRMSLSEYTALRMLSEATDRRLRMSELATACDMSLSGMTRRAARLESLGYIRRVPCASDARGLNAILTDAGLARLRQAWPDHLASVRRRIFDHLGDIDMCALARAVDRMATEG